MIEVFARRTNSPAAAALVAELRAEGRNAREGNAALFDAQQVDRSVVKVYHDGGVAAIPATYAKLGIPCELLPGVEPETAPRATSTDGYSIRQTGRWFSLLGPDGKKVGKSQPSEAEAWALIEEGA